MKKLCIFFFPIFLFFACEEIPPNVGMGTTGPVTGDVVKKVLIEEFTGVRCVNCPAGSEAIEQLIDIHGDRLIAISIHAGNFATPYPESTEDFEVEDGLSILDFLGTPQGFPTAVVNRAIFDGETEMQLAKSKWAGFIDQELAKEAPVEIKLTGNIDDSRMMDISAEITFINADPNEQYRFTLIVTEDNIEDPQETPDGVVADYKHKHVLRDIITPFDGEDIVGTDPITLEFNDYAVPASWNNAELNVIAVVHNSTGNKEIQQVEALEF